MHVAWGIGIAVNLAQAQVVTSPINCHRYVLTPGPTSWTDAEAYAVASGGHLSTLRSAAERDWLLATFVSGPNARRILWIGLSDQSGEGVFGWSSGEPVGFTDWGLGEPNDYRGCVSSGEDWCALNWEYGNGGDSATPGHWNDTPLNGVRFGCGDQPYYGLVELPGADFNGDRQVDFFDYLDFVAAVDAEAPGADFNGDQIIDFFDYLDFVAAFDAGCE